MMILYQRINLPFLLLLSLKCSDMSMIKSRLLIHTNIPKMSSSPQLFRQFCHLDRRDPNVHPNQSVTNIFKYSNIRIYWSPIFIWTFVLARFVCTNIFGHSSVSVLECKNYTNFWIYSNIHIIFNIYSDIHLCQICYTNIFEHSFVQMCDLNDLFELLFSCNPKFGWVMKK